MLCKKKHTMCSVVLMYVRFFLKSVDLLESNTMISRFEEINYKNIRSKLFVLNNTFLIKKIIIIDSVLTINYDINL